MRKLLAFVVLLAGCGEEEIGVETAVAPPEVASVVELTADAVASGTFGTVIVREGWIESLGIAAMDVAAADVDGDGTDELVAATSDGVLIGSWTVEIGRTTQVRAADLDGDGRDEIVARTMDGVCVIDATLEPWWLGSAGAFAIGDVEGDGDAEIVIAGSGSYVLYQWESRSSIELYFAPAAEYDFTALPSPGEYVSVAVVGRQILFAGPGGLRIVELDGTHVDLECGAVVDLEPWDGGVVVVTDDGRARLLRNGAFETIAESGVTGATAAGATLFLLRSDSALADPA